jgi:hypothetical protein
MVENLRDPTQNVSDLLDAAESHFEHKLNAEIRRQDDLREAMLDSRKVEVDHLHEIMSIRTNYEEKLREAEAKRIDAIRAVDVAAVQQTATVSAVAATTLAAQVATSAETLRTQVQAAATAATVALAAALEPIQKDIGELRRYQYEQAGQRVQVLETKGDTQASSNNRQWLIGALVSIGALLVLLLPHMRFH